MKCMPKHDYFYISPWRAAPIRGRGFINLATGTARGVQSTSPGDERVLHIDFGFACGSSQARAPLFLSPPSASRDSLFPRRSLTARPLCSFPRPPLSEGLIGVQTDQRQCDQYRPCSCSYLPLALFHYSSLFELLFCRVVKRDVESVSHRH